MQRVPLIRDLPPLVHRFLLGTDEPPGRPSRRHPGVADGSLGEQWIGNGKLLVALSDDDMIKMSNLKAEGAQAEDHIRTKIADFRKSL